MAIDYSKDAVFYVMLSTEIFRYHNETRKNILIGRPEFIIKEAWAETMKYAENGVKPAKEFKKRGYPNFHNFFKWAANDHHTLEALKIMKLQGPIITGKSIFKHAKKHKKV